MYIIMHVEEMVCVCNMLNVVPHTKSRATIARTKVIDPGGRRTWSSAFPKHETIMMRIFLAGGWN
jgi:hypothetical protein